MAAKVVSVDSGTISSPPCMWLSIASSVSDDAMPEEKMYSTIYYSKMSKLSCELLYRQTICLADNGNYKDYTAQKQYNIANYYRYE